MTSNLPTVAGAIVAEEIKYVEERRNLDPDAEVSTKDGSSPPGSSPPGSFSSPSSDDEIESPGKKNLPIFLENPDGSMLEGVPPGYKDLTPPRSPRSLRQQAWMLPDGMEELEGANGLSLAEEVDFIYGRHERLLTSLLLVQFALEGAYNFVYVTRAGPSIADVVTLYRGSITHQTAEVVFWSMFAAQATYSFGYYCVACYAIWLKKPVAYAHFANWCLIGIAAQVFLAYINQFNLLVFFLRLLSYIYAKFLQNLALSLQLLPLQQAQVAANAQAALP